MRNPESVPWYVYLLQRADAIESESRSQGDRSTYVGITNDVQARLAAHNQGRVRSTKGRRWVLKAVMQCQGRHEAAFVEQWLKCGDSALKRLDFAYASPVNGAVYSERQHNIVRRAQVWYEQRKVRAKLGNPRRISGEPVEGTSDRPADDETVSV